MVPAGPLFGDEPPAPAEEAPLPERMRPRSLDELLGQPELTGPDGLLRRLGSPLPSLLLHGPPGSGKTSLARLLAELDGARFVPLSAVLSGVAELRRAVEEARRGRAAGRRTLLFVDEIHRWSRAQQDALLPHVEDGTVTLGGATTENPSFSVTAPLRSRLRVLRLRRLGEPELVELLRRALGDPRGLAGLGLSADEAALRRLARAADGDARRALLLLEQAARLLPPGARLDAKALESLAERLDLPHDRDAHYDLLSAYIKSMRGSDPDAALYWLARLLEAGEPAEGVARRLVIFAAEDVGNADPRALQLAVAAAQAVQLVGMPEARIPLAQATAWCASAPKSDAAYRGLEEARRRVRELGALPVPPHLRNAPSPGSEARRYRNPHRFPGHVVRQDYLPPELAGERFYRPTEQGAEKVVAERLAWWRRKLGVEP